MKTREIFLLSMLLTLWIPGISQAIPLVWGVWDWQLAEPAHIMVTPGGNGTMLTGAEFLGAQGVDASITIQLWVDDGDTGTPNPQFVPNFPAEDIWLEISGLTNCNFRVNADGPTDSEGWFTFSGSPGMGGWTDPAGDLPQVLVMVSGSVLRDIFGGAISPTIVANSPDINADLAVNLSDVALFAADYYGEYTFRSDFLWDGVINLSDVPLMAAYIGDSCLAR